MASLTGGLEGEKCLQRKSAKTAKGNEPLFAVFALFLCAFA
jgi:hypothetical protein